MKQSILTAIILLFGTIMRAQNIDTTFRGQQNIELTISTPQTRLNETFQLSLDINHVRANIFRSLAGKVEMVENSSGSPEGLMVMNVTAVKKGKNEIAPLSFTVDKTTYRTNKIVYEVIDPLPETDKGLWIRKVITSDSSFCIIVEQRIPAKDVKTINSDNSYSVTVVPEYKEIAKLQDNYSVPGLSSPNAQTTSNYSSVTINGVEKHFMYGYSVYNFTIVDGKAKIKITRDKFENIPVGYKFEDIVVQ